MKTRHPARLAVVGLLASIGLMAAACTTPTTPPAPVNWSFRATNITVNASNDGVYLLGNCINPAGCSDEAYLYQIAFRVKIGEPGSAQTFVVKGNETPSLGVGQSRTLTSGEQATVAFNNIQPLDVLTALNPANKLEVFGTYTWAAESDLINSLGPGADAIAGLFKDALNSTLAGSTLPNGDTTGLVDQILNLLLNNAGAALKILVSNLPCLGLCDDTLGGAVYVGIGVNGTLGALVDSALASATPIPYINMGPDNTIPPDVQGGGVFTLTGVRNFTQTFVGADGSHTYNFTAG